MKRDRRPPEHQHETPEQALRQGRWVHRASASSKDQSATWRWFLPDRDRPFQDVIEEEKDESNEASRPSDLGVLSNS